jgi:membrane fusion protein, heavy metal efflux system
MKWPRTPKTRPKSPPKPRGAPAVLGADKDHPSSIIEIHAPVSGVITDQQVTPRRAQDAGQFAESVHHLRSFHVWIICDVYENDLVRAHGRVADIHLNAYPDPWLKGASAISAPFSIPTFAPPRCVWKWRIRG